jgi:hypothetical protein
MISESWSKIIEGTHALAAVISALCSIIVSTPYAIEGEMTIVAYLLCTIVF